MLLLAFGLLIQICCFLCCFVCLFVGCSFGCSVCLVCWLCCHCLLFCAEIVVLCVALECEHVFKPYLFAIREAFVLLGYLYSLPPPLPFCLSFLCGFFPCFSCLWTLFFRSLLSCVVCAHLFTRLFVCFVACLSCFVLLPVWLCVRLCVLVFKKACFCSFFVYGFVVFSLFLCGVCWVVRTPVQPVSWLCCAIKKENKKKICVVCFFS